MGKEFGVLERSSHSRESDPIDLHVGDVLFVENNSSARRTVYAVDAIEQRSLARSVRSNDGDQFTVAGSEGKGIKSGEPAELQRKVSDLERHSTPPAAFAPILLDVSVA